MTSPDEVQATAGESADEAQARFISDQVLHTIATNSSWYALKSRGWPGRPWTTSGSGGGSPAIWYSAAAVLLMLKGVGPFLEAFAKKLGEDLGESTTTAARRLSARLRGGRTFVEAELPDEAEQLDGFEEFELPASPSITIVLDSDTPDEARIALLYLDMTRPDLRGKTLGWNRETKMWQIANAPEPLAEEV